jgi:FixJ family two-component response regulator
MTERGRARSSGHRPIERIELRAMKGGDVEFLTKPIDTSALLQAVRAALAYNESTSRQQEDLAPLHLAYESSMRQSDPVSIPRQSRGL